MRRFVLALAMALISATALHADCPVHGCCQPSKTPHFFSAPRFHARMHAAVRDGIYRMGLTRNPQAGDMHGHAGYDAVEMYYYDRPYQAHQIRDKYHVLNGTFKSALSHIYLEQEIKPQRTTEEVDLLEYAD